MKVALADVLWEAANEWLRHGPRRSPYEKEEGYSCAAVAMASGEIWLPSAIRDFLGALGCSTYRDDLLHKPWKFTRKSQGVRYMWLLLAMHVAEDENIYVEVTK